MTRRLGASLVTVLILAGCVSAEPPASPAASTPASQAASPSPAAASPPNSGLPLPSASPLPASADPPSPSPPASVVTPAPSAADAELAVPALVATVQPDVRVRSAPGLAATSEKLTPLLPTGTELVVLSGPVAADGYHWYEVTPLARASSLPRGWVAAASRDGEPWLAARTPSCPARPTAFAALAAIPSPLALVCFPRVPITFEARIIDCNCDVDGGWLEPSWFSWGTYRWLIDPSQTQHDPADPEFWLHLDPAAKRPSTLPLGQIVTLTGMFDHPAAEACVLHSYYPSGATPSGACRLEFAVTEIVP